MNLITVPQVGVNDEQARLTWEVTDRAVVARGSTIATLETSKATVDVRAQTAGVLYQLASTDSDVLIGRVVGLIHEQSDLTPEQVQSFAAPTVASQATAGAGKWTKKAELLAISKGVNITDVPSSGSIIREADVTAFLKRAAAGGRKTESNLAQGPVLDTVFDAYPTSRVQRVLLLGGGRGAVQVLDVLMRLPQYRPVGLLDDDESTHGKRVMGLPIVGSVASIEGLWAERKFDAAVISFSNARELRRSLFERLSQRIPFVNVIDPSVTIHTNVAFGQGNVIMAGCRVGSCTVIGDNNFLSAHVNIEHHNRIGSHCTFGPAISTSSRVTVGDFVKFGIGVMAEPGVTIGDNSVIASGAILVGHVPANTLVRTRCNYSLDSFDRKDDAP
ncbi:MAG: biotin/lipoyl-containing protein [Verrucomicrobiota bacterium]